MRKLRFNHCVVDHKIIVAREQYSCDPRIQEREYAPGFSRGTSSATAPTRDRRTGAKVHSAQSIEIRRLL